MATFIKAGFWEKLCQKCTGYKGWLNLDEFVKQNSGGPSYKVYTALLTQEGTNPPTAIVLENTLGGDLTYTYVNQGVYLATLPINYTSGKLWVSATANNNNANALINYYDEYPTGTVGNTIHIITIDPNDGVSINTAMYNTSIEIRIYP